MASPTQRALAECRKRGWTVGIVERWNPHVRIRQDFLGCLDLIACHPSVGILGLQVCSGAGGAHAARHAKIEAEPRALAWLQAGGRIEVWSYALRGARGKRKTYTLRRSRAFVVEGMIGWSEEEA